eukprot:scaffold301614_cov28-Tisochrysis_lutea.AAC.3
MLRPKPRWLLRHCLPPSPARFVPPMLAQSPLPIPRAANAGELGRLLLSRDDYPFSEVSGLFFRRRSAPPAAPGCHATAIGFCRLGSD